MSAFVIALLSYRFSDCPAADDKSKVAETLTVVPTDARGKLEYCAFATRVTREMTRVPDGGPLADLCGQNKQEVEAHAAAYQRDVAIQGQRCFFNHHGLRTLLGL
ncbi:hypothetical protein AB4Y45_33805 [Paraburkholderia sp. EG287A]|uniref:hypothetical protein n=1 Tax=Paraburkholderia sp. EG287A TaxID=3237012 RepID=UPI0034D2F848